MFLKKNFLNFVIDLLISPKRSIYCAEEQIEINIQYKDHIPRYMGTVKARLNRYVLFNPKENKNRFSVKKQIKEVSGNWMDYFQFLS